MNTQEHYLVFDTETIDLRNLSIFDIGMVIVDTKGELIHTEEGLIKGIFDTPEITKAHYYKKNKQFYENCNIPLKSVKEIRSLFNSLIKEYSISRIFACNTMFDIRALNYTFKRFNVGRNIDSAKLSRVGVKLGDIQKIFIGNANMTNYINFCLENNFITDKGNIQYGVEPIIKFIKKNLGYNEAHTALADALDEATILQYIINLPKYDLDKSIASPTHYIKKIRQSWK